MIRISTIFIAICMILVSASLGMVLYAMAGISASESAIVALTALTFLILYNAVSMRLRDRSDAGTQIADLSRGTADLARQVAEFGRRLAAVEGKVVSANSVGQERIQSVLGEINELGLLVQQLAVSVAGHDDMLAAGVSPPSPSVPPPAPFAAVVEPVAEAPVAPAAAPAVAAPASDNSHILTAIKRAIADNQVDLYLQPIVTLPQRKVRFYEAVTRLRDDKDQVLTADDFIGVAETAGLMGPIDHLVMLRCMQVLRRLLVRNKDVGIFCNVAAATLRHPETFAQCLDFLDANRALAASFVLEFKQSTFRNLGPAESERLAALAQRGFRFSIDHVADLRIEPRELADRGVRYIKVPANLLLDQRQTSASDIQASDLSDLLGRFGIDLIAERIEGERAVVDLLDFDVRFGQGFLFAAPRPLRPDAPGATAEPAKSPAAGQQDSNGSARPKIDPPKAETQRITGNAALVRRATGPV